MSTVKRWWPARRTTRLPTAPAAAPAPTSVDGDNGRGARRAPMTAQRRGERPNARHRLTALGGRGVRRSSGAFQRPPREPAAPRRLLNGIHALRVRLAAAWNAYRQSRAATVPASPAAPATRSRAPAAADDEEDHPDALAQRQMLSERLRAVGVEGRILDVGHDGVPPAPMAHDWQRLGGIWDWATLADAPSAEAAALLRRYSEVLEGGGVVAARVPRERAEAVQQLMSEAGLTVLGETTHDAKEMNVTPAEQAWVYLFARKPILADMPLTAAAPATALLRGAQIAELLEPSRAAITRLQETAARMTGTVEDAALMRQVVEHGEELRTLADDLAALQRQTLATGVTLAEMTALQDRIERARERQQTIWHSQPSVRRDDLLSEARARLDEVLQTAQAHRSAEAVQKTIGTKAWLAGLERQLAAAEAALRALGIEPARDTQYRQARAALEAYRTERAHVDLELQKLWAAEAVREWLARHQNAQTAVMFTTHDVAQAWNASHRGDAVSPDAVQQALAEASRHLEHDRLTPLGHPRDWRWTLTSATRPSATSAPAAAPEGLLGVERSALGESRAASTSSSGDAGDAQRPDAVRAVAARLPLDAERTPPAAAPPLERPAQPVGRRLDDEQVPAQLGGGEPSQRAQQQRVDSVHRGGRDPQKDDPGMAAQGIDLGVGKVGIAGEQDVTPLRGQGEDLPVAGRRVPELPQGDTGKTGRTQGGQGGAPHAVIQEERGHDLASGGGDVNLLTIHNGVGERHTRSNIGGRKIRIEVPANGLRTKAVGKQLEDVRDPDARSPNTRPPVQRVGGNDDATTHGASIGGAPPEVKTETAPAPDATPAGERAAVVRDIAERIAALMTREVRLTAADVETLQSDFGGIEITPEALDDFQVKALIVEPRLDDQVAMVGHFEHAALNAAEVEQVTAQLQAMPLTAAIYLPGAASPVRVDVTDVVRRYVALLRVSGRLPPRLAAAIAAYAALAQRARLISRLRNVPQWQEPHAAFVERLLQVKRQAIGAPAFEAALQYLVRHWSSQLPSDIPAWLRSQRTVSEERLRTHHRTQAIYAGQERRELLPEQRPAATLGIGPTASPQDVRAEQAVLTYLESVALSAPQLATLAALQQLDQQVVRSATGRTFRIAWSRSLWELTGDLLLDEGAETLDGEETPATVLHQVRSSERRDALFEKFAETWTPGSFALFVRDEATGQRVPGVYWWSEVDAAGNLFIHQRSFSHLQERGVMSAISAEVGRVLASVPQSVTIADHVMELRTLVGFAQYYVTLQVTSEPAADREPLAELVRRVNLEQMGFGAANNEAAQALVAALHPLVAALPMPEDAIANTLWGRNWQRMGCVGLRLQAMTDKGEPVLLLSGHTQPGTPGTPPAAPLSTTEDASLTWQNRLRTVLREAGVKESKVTEDTLVRVRQALHAASGRTPSLKLAILRKTFGLNWKPAKLARLRRQLEAVLESLPPIARASSGGEQRLDPYIKLRNARRPLEPPLAALLQERVRPHIGPGSTVLDVGAGEGTVLRYLHDELPPTVRWIELDGNRQALAVPRPRVTETVHAVLPDVPLPDASVDVVMSLSALDQLEDDTLRVTLQELARVLRPGGRLIAVLDLPTDVRPEAAVALKRGLLFLSWDLLPEAGATATTARQALWVNRQTLSTLVDTTITALAYATAPPDQLRVPLTVLNALKRYAEQPLVSQQELMTGQDDPAVTAAWEHIRHVLAPRLPRLVANFIVRDYLVEEVQNLAREFPEATLIERTSSTLNEEFNARLVQAARDAQLHVELAGPAISHAIVERASLPRPRIPEDRNVVRWRHDATFEFDEDPVLRVNQPEHVRIELETLVVEATKLPPTDDAPPASPEPSGNPHEQQRVEAANRVMAFLAQQDPLPAHADVLLLLGNDDVRVIERAAALYHEGHARCLIVSGGRGRLADLLARNLRAMGYAMDGDPATLSEAAMMRQMLIQRGVPAAAILMEDRATNTSENLRFSWQRLAALQVHPTSVILLQTPLQMHRTDATATAELPSSIRRCSYAAYVPTITVAQFHTAEGQALLARALDEFAKLTRYAAQGFFAAPTIPPDVTAAARTLSRAPAAAPPAPTALERLLERHPRFQSDTIEKAARTSGMSIASLRKHPELQQALQESIFDNDRVRAVGMTPDRLSLWFDAIVEMESRLSARVGASLAYRGLDVVVNPREQATSDLSTVTLPNYPGEWFLLVRPYYHLFSMEKLLTTRRFAAAHEVSHLGFSANVREQGADEHELLRRLLAGALVHPYVTGLALKQSAPAPSLLDTVPFWYAFDELIADCLALQLLEPQEKRAFANHRVESEGFEAAMTTWNGIIMTKILAPLAPEAQQRALRELASEGSWTRMVVAVARQVALLRIADREDLASSWDREWRALAQQLSRIDSADAEAHLQLYDWLVATMTQLARQVQWREPATAEPGEAAPRTPAPPAAAPRGAAGFTVLETLVALSVLGVAGLVAAALVKKIVRRIIRDGAAVPTRNMTPSVPSARVAAQPHAAMSAARMMGGGEEMSTVAAWLQAWLERGERARLHRVLDEFRAFKGLPDAVAPQRSHNMMTLELLRNRVRLNSAEAQARWATFEGRVRAEEELGLAAAASPNHPTRSQDASLAINYALPGQGTLRVRAIMDGLGGFPGATAASEMVEETIEDVFGATVRDWQAHGAPISDEFLEQRVPQLIAETQRTADTRIAVGASTVALEVKWVRSDGAERILVGHGGDSPAFLAWTSGELTPITANNLDAGVLTALSEGELERLKRTDAQGRNFAMIDWGVGYEAMQAGRHVPPAIRQARDAWMRLASRERMMDIETHREWDVFNERRSLRNGLGRDNPQHPKPPHLPIVFAATVPAGTAATVLLATDGLTDNETHQATARTMHAYAFDPQQGAEALRAHAIMRMHLPDAMRGPASPFATLYAFLEQRYDTIVARLATQDDAAVRLKRFEWWMRRNSDLQSFVRQPAGPLASSMSGRRLYRLLRYAADWLSGSEVPAHITEAMLEAYEFLDRPGMILAKPDDVTVIADPPSPEALPAILEHPATAEDARLAWRYAETAWVRFPDAMQQRVLAAAFRCPHRDVVQAAHLAQLRERLQALARRDDVQLVVLDFSSADTAAYGMGDNAMRATLVRRIAALFPQARLVMHLPDYPGLERLVPETRVMRSQEIRAALRETRDRQARSLVVQIGAPKAHHHTWPFFSTDGVAIDYRQFHATCRRADEYVDAELVPETAVTQALNVYDTLQLVGDQLGLPTVAPLPTPVIGAEERATWLRETLGIAYPDPHRPLIVVNPFSAYQQKELTPADWAWVIQTLAMEPVNVLVERGPPDDSGVQQQCSAIEAALGSLPHHVRLVTKERPLDKAGFVSLLAQCDASVNPDTASMHLADAFGKPSYTFFIGLFPVTGFLPPMARAWYYEDLEYQNKRGQDGFVPADRERVRRHLLAWLRLSTGRTAELFVASSAEDRERTLQAFVTAQREFLAASTYEELHARWTKLQHALLALHDLASDHDAAGFGWDTLPAQLTGQRAEIERAIQRRHGPLPWLEQRGVIGAKALWRHAMAYRFWNVVAEQWFSHVPETPRHAAAAPPRSSGDGAIGQGTEAKAEFDDLRKQGLIGRETDESRVLMRPLRRTTLASPSTDQSSDGALTRRRFLAIAGWATGLGAAAWGIGRLGIALSGSAEGERAERQADELRYQLQRKRENATIPRYPSEPPPRPLHERIQALDPDALAQQALLLFGQDDRWKALITSETVEWSRVPRENWALVAWFRAYARLEIRSVIEEALVGTRSDEQRSSYEAMQTALRQKVEEVLASPAARSAREAIQALPDQRAQVASLFRMFATFERLGRNMEFGPVDYQQHRPWPQQHAPDEPGYGLTITHDDCQAMMTMHGLDQCFAHLVLPTSAAMGNSTMTDALFALLLATHSAPRQETFALVRALNQAVLIPHGLYASPSLLRDAYTGRVSQWLLRVRHAFRFGGREVFIVERLRDDGIRLNVSGFSDLDFPDEPLLVMHEEIADRARRAEDTVNGRQRYHDHVSDDAAVQREFDRQMTLLMLQAAGETSMLHQPGAFLAYYELGTMLHELAHVIAGHYYREIIPYVVTLAYGDPRLLTEHLGGWMVGGERSIDDAIVRPLLGREQLHPVERLRRLNAWEALRIIEMLRATGRQTIQDGARAILQRKAPELYDAFESREGQAFRRAVLEELLTHNRADTRGRHESGLPTSARGTGSRLLAPSTTAPTTPHRAARSERVGRGARRAHAVGGPRGRRRSDQTFVASSRWGFSRRLVGGARPSTWTTTTGNDGSRWWRSWAIAIARRLNSFWPVIWKTIAAPWGILAASWSSLITSLLNSFESSSNWLTNSSSLMRTLRVFQKPLAIPPPVDLEVVHRHGERDIPVTQPQRRFLGAAIGVEQIAVDKSVRRVITNDGVPLISPPDFQLSGKTGDASTLAGMPVPQLDITRRQQKQVLDRRHDVSLPFLAEPVKAMPHPDALGYWLGRLGLRVLLGARYTARHEAWVRGVGFASVALEIAYLLWPGLTRGIPQLSELLAQHLFAGLPIANLVLAPALGLVVGLWLFVGLHRLLFSNPVCNFLVRDRNYSDYGSLDRAPVFIDGTVSGTVSQPSSLRRAASDHETGGASWLSPRFHPRYALLFAWWLERAVAFMFAAMVLPGRFDSSPWLMGLTVGAVFWVGHVLRLQRPLHMGAQILISKDVLLSSLLTSLLGAASAAAIVPLWMLIVLYTCVTGWQMALDWRAVTSSLHMRLRSFLAYQWRHTWIAVALRWRRLRPRPAPTVFDEIMTRVRAATSAKVTMQPSVREHWLDWLQYGWFTLQDIEASVQRTVVEEQALLGRRVEPSTEQAEAVARAQQLVRAYLERRGYWRGEVPVVFVESNALAGRGRLLKYHDIAVVSADVSGAELLDVLVHEMLHWQSYGFKPWILNEGLTYYLMAHILMQEEGVHDRSPRAVVDYLMRLYPNEEEWRYGTSLTAMLVESIGLSSLLHVYCTGQSRDMPKHFGITWARIRQLLKYHSHRLEVMTQDRSASARKARVRRLRAAFTDLQALLGETVTIGTMRMAVAVPFSDMPQPVRQPSLLRRIVESVLGSKRTGSAPAAPADGGAAAPAADGEAGPRAPTSHAGDRAPQGRERNDP